jgi:hypothetical protein
MIHISEVTNTNWSGNVNVYICVSSVDESQPQQEPVLCEGKMFSHNKKNPLYITNPVHTTTIYVHLKKLRL